jgi:predicted branched-subunit amino acid permease
LDAGRPKFPCRVSGKSLSSYRAAAGSGAADFLPLAPGMSAWALVTGVAMAKSGLSTGQAVGLGLIGYAGAAQLAALPFLVAGAPIVLPILSALMVNVRFVIYSAGLTPYLRSLPFWPRLAASYLVSDLGFVLFMRKGAEAFTSPYRAGYYFGASVAIGATWHVACCIGIWAAASIPARWGLDFAGTLALLALLVPMLTRKPSLVGAVVAAVASAALHGLPYRSGVVVGILLGIVVAVWTEPAQPGEAA